EKNDIWGRSFRFIGTRIKEERQKEEECNWFFHKWKLKKLLYFFPKSMAIIFFTGFFLIKIFLAGKLD
ncbi:MAG: hypothetical protein ACJAT4_001582, partial [Granulosicoccus sp.]